MNNDASAPSLGKPERYLATCCICAFALLVLLWYLFKSHTPTPRPPEARPELGSASKVNLTQSPSPEVNPHDQIREDRKRNLHKLHYRLRKLLKAFHAACKLNGVVYWADSGTLLGAQRDGGMIKHDDDVDVCLFRSGLEVLRKYLPEHFTISMDTFVFKMYRKNKRDVWIDLFIVEEFTLPEGELIIRYADPRHRDIWPSFYFVVSEMFPLKEVPFDDARVMVPRSPVPYLERAYGPDWRVPKVYTLHVS
jgi:hypothetical protein